MVNAPVREGGRGAPLLTAVVLTFNEEIHLARCLASLVDVADRIVVVDSGSTDKTREIAVGFGADFFVNKWVNHSVQLNWALENCSFSSEWIIRLDADEYLDSPARKELRQALANSPNHVAGFNLILRRIFLGKWLKYGALYPIRLLRVWRNGQGSCEPRWMDEHMTVSGAIWDSGLSFCDHNLKPLGWWIEKHNQYAAREAIEELFRMVELASPSASSDLSLNRGAALRRFLKNTVYARFPLGIRAALYFVYRYFFRLGFLDGKEGAIFHFLQAFWYRFLVDAKVMEVRILCDAHGLPLESAIERAFGIIVKR